MKRSRSLSLLLMGSLALGPAGCGGDKVEEGMHAFATVDECIVSGLFSEEECAEYYTKALAQTPRFSAREECERAFGESCSEESSQNVVAVSGGNGTVVRQGSGASWMPMMTGFMLGRFMGGGGMMQNSQGLYRSPEERKQPQGGARVFRTRSGDLVRADSGGRVANPSPGIVQSMRHDAKPVMGRSGIGARGGFFGGSGSAS
ncbi:MAG: DUF1190 domain-containing protein [Desulfovibrio sp.]|jgi:uncharacterized protein YgiB involved in biofilm formation|nr:DUF1190 domain-containing protein [Desulfovibrio sp.]